MEEDKKDVKPLLDQTQNRGQGNNAPYVPGQWQDWGKNSGRGGRDTSKFDFDGCGGRLKVYASGKVKMVLGSGTNKISYDVSFSCNACHAMSC